jgi:bla regulator protein BlaR1
VSAPSLLGFAVETFVATTLLMLLVLAIRAPVRRAFGPGIAYALWLLPVLRLVLPPLPEGWREQAAAPVAAMSEVITYYVIVTGSDAPATAASSGIDWLIAVGAVWALGALAFLGYHLIAHGRFCARLLSRARADRTVAQGKVRVIETDAAHGPLAFGIWRKYVAFPRDFAERYDEQERALALAHELGHHVRGDLIANWVALFVLAIHWFNPVAWRAFRAFRADQEMACDALVLAGREAALRHAYGRAIVKSAHGGAVSAACHLHTINELKGRLRMLSKTRKSSPTRIAGGVIGVGALTLAALGITASGTQAAERIKSNVEAATGLALNDFAPQDAPPPPQDAPKAPKAPKAGVAPVAPAAPEAPKERRTIYRVVSHGGEGDAKGKERHRVMIVNGERIDIPGDAEIAAMVPEIRDGHCKEGDPKAMVIQTPPSPGKRGRIVICTNRIEMQTADAHRVAVQARGMGMRSALAGLRHARASVAADTTLAADEKERALKGIDEAIREVSRADKD